MVGYMSYDTHLYSRAISTWRNGRLDTVMMLDILYQACDG